MDKANDGATPRSTPDLETANPATTLFMIGAPTKVLSHRRPRSLISRTASIHPASSARSRPTEGGKANSKPIIYGVARTKRKSETKPVAKSVPLAFPAGTNFMFSAPNLDTKFTAKHQKDTMRAIQILPTDVLVLVVRSIEPNRHHQILKNLSLVSRILNEAIAPILYHSLRLFNLREVYDFALHFRYPTSVTSLEIFLTPDPQDLEWSPPNTNWTEQLVETLRKTERLMSLTIKRCSNTMVLDSITSHSNDLSFLPALQRLSFGYWHQLACLAAGRALTSYGFSFDIQCPTDYESLDRALIALKSSSKSVEELKLTVTFTDRFYAHVDIPNDYREKIMQSIALHFPHLRSLTLRTQSRKITVTKQHRVIDILTLIPYKMVYLSCLELSDPRMPQYRAEATIKVAKQLSETDGLCPSLELLSLDGLLWKRTRDSEPPNPHDLPFELSQLTLNERGGNILLQIPPKRANSDISFPGLTWTPCPSNPRGLTWWAKKAPELRASSKTRSISLLREWMLKYWDLTHLPTDDSRLDRAVQRWR